MRTWLATHSLRVWIILLVGLIVMTTTDVASAQPYPTPDTWGGDILSRPRLTGDWGGFRDDLAKKGVV